MGEEGRQAAKAGERGKVMIYKRGKQGTYWILVRFAGRFVHESTRTASKTVAREAERQRRRELEKKWNRIEKRSLPPTLIEAAKRWQEKRTALAAGTVERYEAALKHVRKGIVNMLVCDKEVRCVVGYQKKRLAQSAAGNTINKENACLSSIFGQYGSWEHVR